MNSTTFLDSTTLIANITVISDAVISNYDIEVRNANGRTGKGIEKFAVESSSTLAYVTLDVTIEDGYNIGPDSGVSGCTSCGGAYEGGVDGVDGGIAIDGNLHFIFTNTPSNGGEPTPRKVYFDFAEPIGPGETPPDGGLYSATSAHSSPALDPDDGTPTMPGPGDCAGTNPIVSGALQRMAYNDCQIHQLGIGFFKWNPLLGNKSDWPRYRLQFHRAESELDDNTSYVVVTCLAEVTYPDETNPRCSQWSVEPSLARNYESFNSAKLIRVDNAKGKTTITHIGYFDMPFRMVLTARQ